MPDPISTAVTSVRSYVLHHLVLLAGAALLVFGAVHFTESLLSSRADAEDQKWQQILTKQQQFSTDLIQRAEEQARELTAVNTSLLQSNQKLAAQISARDTQTQVQIQKDSSLSAVEVSARLGGTTQGENTLLTLPVAREITQKLDTIPSLQADLSDRETELSQEQKIAANLQTELNSSQQIVIQDAITLSDTVRADKARYNKLRADSRRSKLRYFGIGVVTGFILREIVPIPKI